MGIEEMDAVLIFFYTANIINVSILIIIGLLMMTRYFKEKNFAILTLGLFYILISSMWWGSFTLLTQLFFDYELTVEMRILFQVIGSLSLFTWLYTFGVLCFPNFNKKYFIPLYLIVVIFDIYALYCLFVDPSLFFPAEGYRVAGYAQANLIRNLFFAFLLVTVVVTYAFFIKEGFGSEDAKVLWKARLLLVALILFSSGVILAMIFAQNVLFIIISRSMSIIGAIFFYYGWFLPPWLEHKLIKE